MDQSHFMWKLARDRVPAGEGDQSAPVQNTFTNTLAIPSTLCDPFTCASADIRADCQPWRFQSAYWLSHVWAPVLL